MGRTVHRGSEKGSYQADQDRLSSLRSGQGRTSFDNVGLTPDTIITSPPQSSTGSYHTPSTMAEGVLPLSDWKWSDQSLTIPNKEISDMDDVELTAYVVDKLRTSEFNDVRDLIEREKNIQRPIALKEIRKKGKREVAKLDLNRQQRLSALAAFLTIKPVNIEPCQQCANRMSSGPCQACISGGKSVFNGACTNCQYSSTAVNCSLYQSKGGKGKKRARQGKSGEDEPERFRLTEEFLEDMSTREVEEWAAMLNKELAERTLLGTPHKRRRT